MDIIHDGQDIKEVSLGGYDIVSIDGGGLIEASKQGK